MLKRVALMVALAMVIGAEAQAGRFRGGCPTGQCGMSTYQPVQKVAQQAPKSETKVVTASATAPAPAVTSTEQSQQPQYVASQPARRVIFRRFAR
jgi:hypothetical protein